MAILPQQTRTALPGFRAFSSASTLAYLSLIVLIPLSAAFIKTSGMSWAEFVAAVTSPRSARLIPAQLHGFPP